VLAGLHQAIGELPQGAVVLAEDETHVNLLPWVRATWIARGTRQQVMTPGKNRRRTVFGALDLHTGRWFYQVARKAVSASFIAFLEQLAAAYPAAPTVAVICDNVIVTTPRSCSGGWPPTLESWCCMGRATARMTTGRADLGDAQGVAGRLPTATVQSRIRQVHALFRQRSPTDLLATAAPHSSPWLPQGYMQNFREAA
jgi:hypothetical protein